MRGVDPEIRREESGKKKIRVVTKFMIQQGTIRSVHFSGICGTAMASTAAAMKDRGFTVTGSDQNVYPPMSDFLVGKGIEVLAGFKSSNLEHRPDLVVIGNALSRGNPEV